MTLNEFVDYIEGMLQDAGVQPAMDVWHDDFVFCYNEIRKGTVKDVMNQTKDMMAKANSHG